MYIHVHTQLCTHARLHILTPCTVVPLHTHTYLHLDLHTTRTKEGLVYHVLAVGHPNDQDVVQLLHTIHLERKESVD